MKKGNISKIIREKILFIMLLLTVSTSLRSNDIGYVKDSVVIRMYQYKFPNATENVLVDSAHSLLPFFNQLKALKSDSAFVVPICHVGDSHIQADVQTGITRRMFQDFFGDAGRGLIVPLKLAKTNEPRNYRISSPQIWNSVKCIKQGEYPVGIGGIVLTSADSIARLKIETMDAYNPERWQFNDITVFYDTTGVALNIPDSLPITCTPIKETTFTKRLLLDSLVTSIDLSFTKTGGNPTQFYGINLQNGYKGVIYHSIGMNGAHYEDYANSPRFSQQMKELTPSLIIISLGANEVYARNFNSEQFYNNIDLVVKQLKSQCPDAILLLTTPAETWYRYRSSKYRKPHPNVIKVRNAIVKYATENQLAYWDLFSITGGKGSAQTWKKYNLVRRDGVHLTQDGYEYIGELFFEAIYNGFRKNTENKQQAHNN